MNKIITDNKHLVLVLNNYYVPVNICTVNRAYKLISKDRCEIVEEDETPFFGAKQYPRPSIIRLYNPIKHHSKKVTPTRNNIFKRDEHECGYCPSNINLTLDHITPKSKGGGWTWENLITCCKKCNSKKGDRTPEQAGMELKRKPFKPTFINFLKYYNGQIKKGWSTYLK